MSPRWRAGLQAMILIVIGCLLGIVGSAYYMRPQVIIRQPSPATSFPHNPLLPSRAIQAPASVPYLQWQSIQVGDEEPLADPECFSPIGEFTNGYYGGWRAVLDMCEEDGLAETMKQLRAGNYPILGWQLAGGTKMGYYANGFDEGTRACELVLMQISSGYSAEEIERMANDARLELTPRPQPRTDK